MPDDGVNSDNIVIMYRSYPLILYVCILHILRLIHFFPYYLLRHNNDSYCDNAKESILNLFMSFIWSLAGISILDCHVPTHSCSPSLWHSVAYTPHTHRPWLIFFQYTSRTIQRKSSSFNLKPNNRHPKGAEDIQNFSKTSCPTLCPANKTLGS